MEEILDLALKRIIDLEKKLEMYYKLLFYNNDLDAIMKGTYYLDTSLGEILDGSYSLE